MAQNSDPRANPTRTVSRRTHHSPRVLRKSLRLAHHRHAQRSLQESRTQIKTNTTIFLPLTRGMTLASLIFAPLALGNAAFTAVTEQRWTLGLQRALGMSRRQIARSLALEAATIGLTGAIGGALVGVGLGIFAIRVLAYQVAVTVHYTIPWSLVAASAVLGVVVAVSATAYPRRIARRVTIVESLRFE